jgi:xyloglucan fucosyltransferase
LIEIYLLSLTDRIVTSGMSTFGYVSHALGGLASHIMIRTMDEMIPNSACVRTTSMESCAFSVQHFGCKEERLHQRHSTHGAYHPHPHL